MSEQEAVEVVEPEPKKKKKGKLPVLLALVAVLGGGGFFAMKMRAPKEHKIEAGEMIPLAEEFLSNLKDANIYVRVHVALQIQKGYEKKKLEDKMPAVSDAIYMILSDKSQAQVKSLDGKMALKREIAEAINKILEEPGHDKKAAPKSAKDEKKPDVEGAEPKREHPDWDSDTGPVLKVYFTSFATQ